MYISPLILLLDIVSINGLTLSNTKDYQSMWRQTHYDVTEKTLMSVLKDSTYIITTVRSKNNICLDFWYCHYYVTSIYAVIAYHQWRGCCSRDRMVVGFITTCAMSAYHHWRCEFESWSGRGVLDTTLWDKVCQWLATGWWFPPPIKLTTTI